MIIDIPQSRCALSEAKDANELRQRPLHHCSSVAGLAESRGCATETAIYTQMIGKKEKQRVRYSHIVYASNHGTGV